MRMPVVEVVLDQEKTLKEAEKVPADAYVWLGFAVVAVAPSPNCQLYVSAVPSGSDEPALEKFTVNGTVPVNGAPLAAAIGGWLVATTALVAVIVMAFAAVVLVPSDTLRSAEY